MCRNNTCTYLTTGTKHAVQEWATCLDCFRQPTEGACLSCLAKCHQGHRIGEIRQTSFYCDCGPQSNQLTGGLNPPENHIFDAIKKNIQSNGSQTDYKLINYGILVNTLNSRIWKSLNKTTNSVFSPYSLRYALDLVALGTARETKRQTFEVLGLGNMTRTDLANTLISVNNSFSSSIKVANGLFVRDDISINTNFKDVINKIGKIDRLDLNVINDWASNSTNGLIKKVLDNLGDDTVCLLANAIYFKSNWKYPFESSLTRPQPFAGVGGRHTVDMMHMSNHTFPYSSNATAQLIELPYVDDTTCFGIYLPKPKLIQWSPVSALFSADLNSQLTSLQRTLRPVEVDLCLPKFRVESDHQLTQPVKQLGLTQMFNRGVADFGHMTPESVVVSKIIQKAVIIVDETGTEAAAVTSVLFDLECCVQRNTVRFHADRPFLYYIRHIPSNTLLFVGSYLN